MIKKFFGLFLLFLGLVIIFYSLHTSYNVFTTKAPAPEIFKMERPQIQEIAAPQKGIQAQIQKMIREQLEGTLPVEDVPKLLNLITWSILPAF